MSIKVVGIDIAKISSKCVFWVQMDKNFLE